MAKFKHKNGGIAEVFTKLNIERLRKNKDYKEIVEDASEKVKKEPKKEVVEGKPLQ